MTFFFDWSVKNDKKYIYVAWLVILFGFFLRFFYLDKVGLWSDELFTVATALDVGKQASWLNFTPKVIQELTFNDSFLTWKAADNTPPLFDLLLMVWAKIFGNSDLSLRVLPAILGATAPLIFFHGLKKPLGAYAALLATSLFVFSPVAIAYSQEVRSYTLALFFSTIAVVRVVNHVASVYDRQELNSWKSSVWLDVILYIAMGYSHYTGLFTAALLAAIYLLMVSLLKRKYSDVLKFLLVPVAMLPWLWISKKAFLFSSSGGYAWRDYSAADIFTVMVPGTLNFFLPGGAAIFCVVLIAICIFVLTGKLENGRWIFSFYQVRKEFLNVKVILATLFAAAIVLLFLYSIYNSFTSKMWHPRYFLVALPIVFAIFGLLFSALNFGKILPLLFALIILLISTTGIKLHFKNDIYAKEEYREAAKSIAENAPDNSVILMGWGANVAYYRHYLDMYLEKSRRDQFVMQGVSSPDEVRQACTELAKPGRHFFVFQHQTQSKYYEDLGKCPGIVKIAERKFRGVIVVEYAF